MDYDRIFETDMNRNFFYTDYPGKNGCWQNKLEKRNSKTK